MVDPMAAGSDGKLTNHTIAGTDGARTPREVGRRALDALGPHVEAVQRLADAAGAREATERAVTVARERAAELIRRVRADAADLLQAAAAERRDARVAYRDVFAAAVSTGWTADQLISLGFDRVLLRPRRPGSAMTVNKSAGDGS